MHKKNILVVDDSRANVELMQMALANYDFNVLISYNTDEARHQLLTNNVDVMLLDINMPGQDGLSFCKELRDIERFELLPILFVSSLDREFGFKEAIANGGDDFINKPFKVNELVAKINAFIRIKELQDEILTQKKKYEEEIHMSRKIQSHLVSEKKFEWNYCRIKTMFRPFSEVGGDFFDVWEENGKLFMVIADCSGKGVSAALISAMFKMQLISLPGEAGLLEKTRLLKENLRKVLPQDYYITFILAELTADFSLSFVNAGHNPGLIWNRGEVEQMTANANMIIQGDVIGSDSYSTIQLEKGSKILLYTDGISEVSNADYKILGVKNFMEYFREAATAEDTTAHLFDMVMQYSGNRIEDDIAIILVEL